MIVELANKKAKPQAAEHIVYSPSVEGTIYGPSVLGVTNVTNKREEKQITNQ